MHCTEIGGVRYYLDDLGKKYRSVTGILSATKTDRDKLTISNWRSKKGPEQADKIFNDACARGTATHKYAEQYLMGEDVVLDYEPAVPYWKSLEPALRPIKNIKAMEVAISHPLGYAGRFDCFGEYKGIENTVIDFKTSMKPKRREYINDYCYQLAAYAGGIFHTLGEPVNQGVVIIAVPNRVAQTFVLSKEELLIYWELWLKRVEHYHIQESQKEEQMCIDNLSKGDKLEPSVESEVNHGSR